MSTTVKTAPIPPSRQREKPGQQLKWIGKNIKRVEDPRLLTGQGRYIDDIDLPNMLHAAVLRSTRAHARIKSIDVAAAAALAGVVKVLTGADIARATGPLPCFSQKACCTGCSASARPSDSTVSTLEPSACTARQMQDRAATPSTSTVQVPQIPCSQPTWVPVRLSS